MEGTKKLEDELFDASPEELYTFLKSLARRAKAYGWDDENLGTFQIPEDSLIHNSPTRSLIDNYGSITLANVKEFDEGYLFNQLRAAQDNTIIFQCLMNSLTSTGRKKLQVLEKEYTIENPAIAGEYEMSANALLKIIIRVSHIDTKATTATIKMKLQSLDKYILTIACDIDKFNMHVNLLLESL